MDRKTVLAFLLIGLIIILMPYYYQIFMPPPEVNAPDSLTIKNQMTPEPTPEPTEEKTKAPIISLEPTVPDTFTDLLSYSSAEKTYWIETGLYIAEVSNINVGTMKKFILKNFQTRTRTDTFQVELIPENTSLYPLLIETLSPNGDSVYVDFPAFVQFPAGEEPDDDTVRISGNEEYRISFYVELNGGPRIEKELVFHGNSYVVDVSIHTSKLKEWVPTKEYRLSWKSGLKSTEANFSEDMAYARAYAYLGEELETIDAKKGKKSHTSLEGAIDWVAMRTKYFVAAIIPERPAASFVLAGHGLEAIKGEKQPYKKFSAAIDIPLTDNRQTDKFKIYIGPLDYKQIHSLNVHLERIMNFGMSMIRPISKGILNLFITMHKVIPNYGIVLIIFAILVKVVLYPLTHKSFQSMKQMQALQPLMLELREKFKDDPKRLQAETMKLYKEYKVNPLGGCLPMLFQLPLLWALFIVFRTTIELRNAPFFWWITDLSAPDTVFVLPFMIPLYGNTVNILPIVMAITMIFQQKMSTTTTTPQQKYMMYFMPIFFFMLFNQFPSGLNLYYTLFNVLSMLQQRYLVKSPEIEIKPSTAKNKRRQPRKK